jgi:hypothetical protein
LLVFSIQRAVLQVMLPAGSVEPSIGFGFVSGLLDAEPTQEAVQLTTATSALDRIV